MSQIADICRWYVADRLPNAQRQATALAELAHITRGRTELLARFAGQRLAELDGDPDATAHDHAVQLCITAGADMSLIDQWSRDDRRPGATRVVHRSSQ